mmetsp:Transcript_56530/g.169081  ORF Transcript_56530/g.169081 Transcript_56530/m.169081 type:complete len:200 (-) Transcript_56530:23-622(-)
MNCTSPIHRRGRVRESEPEEEDDDYSLPRGYSYDCCASDNDDESSCDDDDALSDAAGSTGPTDGGNGTNRPHLDDLAGGRGRRRRSSLSSVKLPEQIVLFGHRGLGRNSASSGGDCNENGYYESSVVSELWDSVMMLDLAAEFGGGIGEGRASFLQASFASSGRKASSCSSSLISAFASLPLPVPNRPARASTKVSRAA